MIVIKAANWLIRVITILFIGLKITRVIDWSWWWVLAPTLIPFAILLLIILVIKIINLVDI